MNKQQIAVGLILSLCLHIVFLFSFGNLGRLKKETNKIEEVKKKACSVVALLPDESSRKNKEYVSKKPPREKTKANEVVSQKQKQVKIQDFKKLFKSKPVKDIREAKGDFLKSDNADSDLLPELKIDISDEQILLGAVRFFGMKIVAIDNFGALAGEIKINSEPQFSAFKGNLSKYSNRVRFLPIDYFGKRLADFIEEKRARLCLLVPVSVDIMLTDTQREAVSEHGCDPSQVWATAGEFVNNNGRYSFVVTEVVLK